MYKISIIGAGYMAKEHIKAFSNLPNVSIVGIFSRTKSKAIALASEFNIPFVGNSVRELYTETNSDAVVITVSVNYIFSITMECFNFPWVCLIEKPVGYNFEEAELLNNYTLSLRFKAYVALNRRHYCSTSKLLSELDPNGSNRIVKIQDQEDMNDPIRLGHPLDVINNWMYSNSIHLIDYFLLLCRGNLLKIRNVIEWDLKNPSFVLATLEFDSGDIGIYEAYWNTPCPWLVSVTTKEARWEMAPLETLTKQVRGSRTKDTFGIDKKDFDYKPGLRKQAELFVEILEGKTPQLPTLIESFDTMKLIKLIYNQ
jgi:predicted dehydrogenase